MSGFSRPTDRHSVSVGVALRHGHYVNPGANIKVFFDGTCETLETFEGPWRLATGLMHFWHHGSNVLSVDFDNDRITDYGYHGYSQPTTLNIYEWVLALRGVPFMDMACLDMRVYDWTWTDRRTYRYGKRIHPVDTAGDKLLWTYRTTAPWVRLIEGWPWFDGKAYDPHVVDRAAVVMASIINGGWRWFTGEWVNGEWTQRFIDAAAEKRYNRRRSRP